MHGLKRGPAGGGGGGRLIKFRKGCLRLEIYRNDTPTITKTKRYLKSSIPFCAAQAT